MDKVQQRAAYLKEIYDLKGHEEGGSFSEVYTAPCDKDGRPLAGSIYFMLNAGEISHFHEIDCDELWFYHEGCGMRITMLSDGGIERHLLGGSPENGELTIICANSSRAK